MGVSEEKKEIKRIENMLETIMNEISPKLMSDIKPQIQEVTSRGTKIQFTSDFSLETTQTKREQSEIFNV